jgi:hypothetical protein
MQSNIHSPPPLAAPDQASHVAMPEYLLVFRDDGPPKEHAFTAISDDAAAELMRKQYPRFAWSLYHVDDRGSRGECFDSYPGRPHPPADGASSKP